MLEPRSEGNNQMASIPSCLTCHSHLLETDSVYQPATETFIDPLYHLREKYTPASHKETETMQC